MSQQTRARHGGTRPPSGLAVGVTTAASILMIMTGSFQALQGFVGLFEDELYVATENYVLQLDTTTWGWVHLLLGILLILAGLAVLSGQVWARTVGVIVAVVSAVSSFAFIPYYPFWALTIIAFDVFVIWALTAHGRDITEPY